MSEYRDLRRGLSGTELTIIKGDGAKEQFEKERRAMYKVLDNVYGTVTDVTAKHTAFESFDGTCRIEIKYRE